MFGSVVVGGAAFIAAAWATSVLAPRPAADVAVRVAAAFACAVATGLAAWTGWRSRGSERRWRLLLAGALAFSQLPLVELARAASGRGFPDVSSRHAVYLLGYVLAIAAIVAFPAAPPGEAGYAVGGTARRRYAVLVLDGLLVAGSLALLNEIAVVRRDGADLGRLAAFAATGAAAVAAAAMLRPGFRWPWSPLSFALLAGGVVAHTLSAGTFLHVVGGASPDLTPPLAVGLVAGPVLMALACLAPPPARDSPQGRVALWACLMLAYLPVGAVAVVALVLLPTRWEFDDADLYGLVALLVVALARQMILLADNARLLGVARLQAIQLRRLARERLALLNEASSKIGSTLDVVRTAEELAEVAVPGYADVVTVDLLEAVHHSDRPPPGRLVPPVVLRRATFRSCVDGMPIALGVGQAEAHPESSPPARSLATGRPILHRITDPEIVHWVADNPVRAAAASNYGLHSVMFVPLRARGMILGMMFVGRQARVEPFTDDDLLFADELCAKAALAIDNARRYTRERTVALALQRSLLPPRLPDHPAVDVATRYRPAEFGVGGDWYDVIPLSGARVALVVGDVVGHGIHAAATMGRLRTAIRTLADSELPPEELLTRIDDVLTRLTVEENLTPDVARNDIDDNGDNGDNGETGALGATCLYAVYDPLARRCTLARAGHPPPAAVTPDGRVTFLKAPAGLPLGLCLGGSSFEAVEVDLPVGTLLALYTDGLVESRDLDLDEGLGELRRVLATPTPTLDALCGAVLDALLPDHPADDATLLLARTLALDEHQVASWDLPADLAAVADARARTGETLTAWGLDELAFTTQLVVSELVTNAILHGRGPIGLRLIRTGALTCEVSDTSGAAPHLRRAGTFDEDGRGLLLVAQLTDRWGSRPTAGGKTIWAEQQLPRSRRGGVAARGVAARALRRQ